MPRSDLNKDTNQADDVYTSEIECGVRGPPVAAFVMMTGFDSLPSLQSKKKII